MKFPQRLIADDGDTGKSARDLLVDSDFGLPPDGASQKVWAGLAARISGHNLLNPDAPPPHAPALQPLYSTRLPFFRRVTTRVVLIKASAVIGAAIAGSLGAFAMHRASTTQSSQVVANRASPKGKTDSRATPRVRADAEPIATLSNTSLPSVAPVILNSQPRPARENKAISLKARPQLEPPTIQTHDPQDPASASPPAERRGATELDTARAAREDLKRSQLLRESALLEQGRSALRTGKTGEAWRILEQWAAEFPQGQLSQEREVLHIELLWHSGRRDLAIQRIRAFINEHPGSAHAARLRALLSEAR